MPGVLMLEAMAQAAALLSFATQGVTPDDKTVYYFAGIDAARFKRPVEPGDQLVMDVELLRAQGRHLQVQGRRARGRGAGLRGRADVHHAHRGLIRARPACPTSIPRPSSTPGAQLDSSVQVGPYTLIGPHVKIGAGTTVAGHVVIEGHTTIGRDNRIFQFGSIGAANQDKKYAGEPCELVIGDRNTIREFVTLHIGTVQDKAVTRIGDDNWIMAYTHIAHDCVVGNNTTMANNTTLAGHVELGDWVTVGGLTGIHQFVKVGAHAMVGFASAVSPGRAALHAGGRQPAGGARLQRRGPAPARLQRRAHRCGQADAQAAVPRRPHAGRRPPGDCRTGAGRRPRPRRTSP